MVIFFYAPWMYQVYLVGHSIGAFFVSFFPTRISTSQKAADGTCEDMYAQLSALKHW
jgi:hypothetical protein